MSYSLNSSEGVTYGIIYGTPLGVIEGSKLLQGASLYREFYRELIIIGVIKGDTRNLDYYGSYGASTSQLPGVGFKGSKSIVWDVRRPPKCRQHNGPKPRSINIKKPLFYIILRFGYRV